MTRVTVTMETEPKWKRRAALPCPSCGCPFSAVKRTKATGSAVRRVRKCLECKKTYCTTEAWRGVPNIAQLAESAKDDRSGHCATPVDMQRIDLRQLLNLIAAETDTAKRNKLLALFSTVSPGEIS